MTAEPKGQSELKGSIRGELAALILLSLGGLLMHWRYHPIPLPGAPSSHVNIVPFLLGLAGVIIVPILLAHRKTWLTGYLINGFAVITGAVMMGYLGISGWSGMPGLETVIFDSMLPVILISIPKLIVGQMILRHYRPGGTGRLFTPLWWTRHFIYVSAVFAAGKLLGG
jgi:hypothetical protein